MPTKLVILDRDGVINFDSAQFIKNPTEWKPIPGSLEAIARLTQSGYKVVVATNQSGVGRGRADAGADPMPACPRPRVYVSSLAGERQLMTDS